MLVDEPNWKRRIWILIVFLIICVLVDKIFKENILRDESIIRKSLEGRFKSKVVDNEIRLSKTFIRSYWITSPLLKMLKLGLFYFSIFGYFRINKIDFNPLKLLLALLLSEYVFIISNFFSIIEFWELGDRLSLRVLKYYTPTSICDLDCVENFEFWKVYILSCINLVNLSYAVLIVLAIYYLKVFNSATSIQETIRVVGYTIIPLYILYVLVVTLINLIY